MLAPGDARVGIADLVRGMKTGPWRWAWLALPGAAGILGGSIVRRLRSKAKQTPGAFDDQPRRTHSASAEWSSDGTRPEAETLLDTFSKMLAAMEAEGVLRREQHGRQWYVVPPDLKEPSAASKPS